MQQTQNYNLNKPDRTDYAIISALNTNADIIDAKLKELNDNGDLTEIQQSVSNLDNRVTTHLDKDAKTIKVKRNVTMLATNWTDDTATSGFFIYDIADTDISVNTIVDVNVHLTSLEDAIDLKPITESYNGYVRLYADGQPTENITVDLKLIRELGVV